MEIDCPPQAIAVWLVGETLWVRFPDQQLVDVPVEEFPRIITVLRHREHEANQGKRSTVGMPGAPVQYDLERPQRTRDELAAREVRRKANRRFTPAEASELLELAGF